VKDVDITFDPAVVAPVRAAAHRAKGGALVAAGAHAGDNIDVAPEATPSAPVRALAGRGKAGVDFVAGGAHFVSQVDIPLDPAPGAAHFLTTNRAKRRHFATPALLAHHIHISHHAAPAASERALGVCGGKGGRFFAARRAHFVFQVDITLDPAPRAVHFLATNRAKRRILAAPAPFVQNIHISRHAAPAAPERFLCASAGEIGAFFAADGALGVAAHSDESLLFFI
jgi:hypothetical protein